MLADLVQRGDPDRFAATLAMPAALRERLWVLWAFNLEVARAPWVSTNPLIAEMRLQFWADVVEEATPRAHEVAGPLHEVMTATPALRPVLAKLIAARRLDIAREPFADSAFDAYLEDTAAGLLWAAALSCEAPPEAETAFRALGWAMGLANFLRALPELQARGWAALDMDPAALRLKAQEGLNHLAIARAQRAAMGRAAPVALVGWQAGGLLHLAEENPLRVGEGKLALSEFRKRGGLLWQAFTGRF
ncbi:squalene/phytoene synthase family protein [Stagnihabitans tardus]|uniref:Squalene/phytoene synthase family protein n=1 Tax=Stagnihabitans tardus TaxID=2699202 RepID=A0AAE4Y7W1_9RHOB|nr:squalene/phytoene synthase family protein [Stagnihabitans tardus]NBZ87511.1 squalene/phytoene synthase family protein [Stagnihabitans tardus]